MTTSCEPVQGDIWLVYLHFADHPEIGKVRPVVVVDVRHSEAVVLKVTSKPPRPNSDDYAIERYADAGLRVPSSVWIRPAFVVTTDELLRDGPIGHLIPSDWSAIERLLLA